MKRNLFTLIILSIFVIVCSVVVLKACSKVVYPTQIVVQDSIRHYYPLIQGQDIVMKYRIANIGKEPLVITDIIAGAGCESIDKQHNNIILP